MLLLLTGIGGPGPSPYDMKNIDDVSLEYDDPPCSWRLFFKNDDDAADVDATETVAVGPSSCSCSSTSASSMKEAAAAGGRKGKEGDDYLEDFLMGIIIICICCLL